MERLNWSRIVLGGLLAGVVWGVLYAIVLPLVGREFVTSLPGFRGHYPGNTATMRAIVSMGPVLVGISTMWLYAAIRPRYGPGPKTAMLAGFALWFFGSVVDVEWAALGAVPVGAVVGPVAASLPIVLLAAAAGAWVYNE